MGEILWIVSMIMLDMLMIKIMAVNKRLNRCNKDERDVKRLMGL